MGAGRDRQLRAATELALRVAAKGEKATPPQPAPAALRRILGFRKVTPKMLVQVRRAVDTDDEFRARVAAQATEREVGRSGVAWLCRPDGWEAELDRLSSAAEEAEAQRREADEERRASRRLASVEDAARRAEARALDAERSIEQVRDALAAERVKRREIEDALTSAHAHAADVEQRRRRAVRELEAAKSRLAERTAEVAELRERLHTTSGPAREPVPPEAIEATPESPAPSRDLGAVGRAIDDAAKAAAQLSIALEAAGDALHVESSPPPRAPRVRTPVARRQAPKLPGGVFDDAEDAANHYLVIPNMVCLVDGYNVSKGRWPHLSIAEQRRSLVEALANLAARTGGAMDVVFDGVHEPDEATARSTPSPIRVRFTTDGVEADDLILELIDEYPTAQPIVVVSSDGRVRDGARGRGAAILSSRQLAHVL